MTRGLAASNSAAPNGVNCPPRSAFTLLELLTIAAILVIASVAIFPIMARFYEGQKLRQAAIELQSHLLRARSLAQRQQSICTISLSNGAAGADVQVTGTLTRANNPSVDCLASLNLSQLTGVRGLGLCVTHTSSGVCTVSGTIDNIVFLPMGVLVGAPRTLILSGSGTPAQVCLALSLSLIRVGYRPSGSGACSFAAS